MAVLSRVRPANISSRIMTQRSYVSSSAARIEEYDYDTEPESEWEDGVPVRRVQWVVMGHPMSKKHVYAQKLSKLLEVPHISIASLVRQDLHPPSSLYKQIANSVNQGKLVPEDIIFGLLSKRLEEGYVKGETGFILDGLPRTKMQAAILDQIADIDLVVNFKCTGNSLKQHLEDKIYSPSAELLGLSNSGLSSAAANAENVWKKKVSNFEEQNKPLEDYYKQQRKLFDFQVGGAPGETWSPNSTTFSKYQCSHLVTKVDHLILKINFVFIIHFVSAF